MKLKQLLVGEDGPVDVDCELYEYKGILFAITQAEYDKWQSFCAKNGFGFGVGNHQTKENCLHCSKAVIDYRQPETFVKMIKTLKTINHLSAKQIEEAKQL